MLLHYCLDLNSDRQVVMFLHGFMGNIYEFDNVIKLLNNNFSYLTVDLPGHGKTEVLGGSDYYGMENTAQAIINLLDELKIEKCFLVGYSMGGRIALYLTINFPERFIKVVLESSSPGLSTDFQRIMRIKSDAGIIRKLTRISTRNEFGVFLNNWYSQPIFGQIKNHPAYPKMIETRLANSPLKIAKSLQFMGTGYQPSLWHKLEYNQIPLLLLVGEYDQKFIDINTVIYNLIPGSKLVIINRSAHNTHLENPLMFVEYIMEFFRVF
ncbi:2-succinyl-6-hydroxy-2,4-cyclohexadiene-1-carboxylate synthase [Cylindrospermopsis raciborskii CS-508]|nr:2-succinyl-6-hydroxy-2,4-cyclohexadiene-1-carboxylate synthase [Cylindrospermopsis raciborskii CS-508]